MRWRDLAILNKADRQMITVVAIIAATVILFVRWNSSQVAEGGEQDSLDMPASQFVSRRTGNSWNAKPKRSYDDRPLDTPAAAHHLVPFDPNTADSTTLLGMGLPRWMVRSIYKFRAHGGVYHNKEDFAQTPHMTLKQYRELEPYIHISDLFQPASNTIHNGSDDRSQYEDGVTVVSANRRYEKLAAGQTIDLATADTLELRKVPGIGMGFAKAIVNRRQRLGGFASTDQLMEISGFPEDALPYFTISQVNVKRININRLSLDRLRAHPYINFYRARDIVEHRAKHGPIHDLNELSIYTSFSADVIRQLQPYIEY